MLRRFPVPFLVLALLAGGVHAADRALAPFEAEYGLSVGWLPLGKAVFRLAPAEGEDRYRAEVKARLLAMRNVEVSEFTWNGCEPRTEAYFHEFKGLGMRRFHDMTFEWDDGPRVVNVERDDRRTYEIPAHTLDEITVLLRSRCVFSEGAQDYLATTAYGNKVRTHQLRVVGRETIDGPDGPVETVRVEKVHREESDRRTIIWVAPELDWMMVRARHSEGGITGRIVLRDYRIATDGAGEVASSGTQ